MHIARRVPGGGGGQLEPIYVLAVLKVLASPSEGLAQTIGVAQGVNELVTGVPVTQEPAVPVSEALPRLLGWLGMAAVQVMVAHAPPLVIALDTIFVESLKILIYPTLTTEDDLRLIEKFSMSSSLDDFNSEEVLSAVQRVLERVESMADEQVRAGRMRPSDELEALRELQSTAKGIRESAGIAWLMSDSPDVRREVQSDLILVGARARALSRSMPAPDVTPGRDALPKLIPDVDPARDDLPNLASRIHEVAEDVETGPMMQDGPDDWVGP